MRAIEFFGPSQDPKEQLLVQLQGRSHLMARWEEFEGGTPRAPRFPLKFPLQYRPNEDVRWRQGLGTNISRSGLLFRTVEPVPMSASVEVSFVMPAEIPEESRATVVCHGRVVRQMPGDSQGEVVVATTIETYRLQRAGKP